MVKGKINYKIFTFILAFISIFITSCSPKEPYPPRVSFLSIEDVVIDPVEVNIVKTTNEKIFSGHPKIAVFDFEGPEETQGGVLISDMFTSILERQNIGEIIERDNINQILQEQKLLSQNQTSLNEEEIANRLGKLISVDYMVFGSVTLYQSEPQTINVPIEINQEDLKNYAEEYEKYKEWYLNKLFPINAPEKERLKLLFNQENILSPNELENEYSSISRTTFEVVASVGISAKIINIKNGEVVWVGQGTTNDLTLVSATKRILEEFILSI
jgi:hypothetical protein